MILFSACDKCTQILFSEIDQLSNTLTATTAIGNYTTSSWNLLAKNIEKIEKLIEKYHFVRREIDDLLENPKILNLDSKIQDIFEKTRVANKIAEENILKTDHLFDKINNIIIKGRDRKRILSSLLNDINSFAIKNISVEYALQEAEHTNREIGVLSKALNFHQDRKVLDFCSDIRNKINRIYEYSQNIPNDKVQYLEKILNDIMNIDAHIEADLERVNLLNKKNAEELKDLKTKIDYLNNKTKKETDDVALVLSKIQVTNEILNQLQQVYQNLANIAKNEETITFEKRIKNHILSLPEIEVTFLKSIEHVQELENKVNNYSR